MSGSDRPRPSVAIVVVGYNESAIVSDCLRSLRTIDYAPLSVIYVDNDSPDGSLEHVRTRFPEVTAIPSGGNLGYCGGNNVGIARALGEGAEFVLILNPDTVVCNPGFVATLVDYMLAHPAVGKTGPKVYLRQSGTVQNTILEWPSIVRSVRSILRTLLRREGGPKSAAVTVPTDVESLNGCCLFVRADALRDVGLYDAAFWGYVDEVDWDWKAARAGWQRHYVPVESIIHLQKVTGYDFASRANHYLKRNTALWYAKTGKWVSMTVWMMVTLAIAAARALFSPLLGRSPGPYFRFLGTLAAAYARVVSDLASGRLRRLEPAAPDRTGPGTPNPACTAPPC